MKIISQNVQGMNSLAMQHYIINQCKAYDLSFLLETKLTLVNRLFLKAKWGSEMVYMVATNTARRGVITLVHPRCAAIPIIEAADDRGQYHIILMRIRDRNYLLCNIYGDPTSDQEAHNTLNKLNDKMEEIKTQYPIDHYILGGDYNQCLERRHSTSSSGYCEKFSIFGGIFFLTKCVSGKI